MTDPLLDRIDQVLAAGEPDKHGALGDPRCAWCGHPWHGLRCAPGGVFGAEYLGEPCRCDSSFARLDDTWRPALDASNGWLLRRMHREGLDGWAALTQPRRRGFVPLDRRRLHDTGRAIDFRLDPDTVAHLSAALSRAFSVYADAFTRAAAQLTPWFIVTTDEAGVIRVGGLPVARIANGTVHDTYGPTLDEHQLLERAAASEVRTPGGRSITGPAAHAIIHTRHRNTGPARPPAGRARRPRTHTGA